MTTAINRDQVRNLVENGGQLVEVLSPKQYEDAHLAGVINIPLSELDQRTTARLQKDQPVITYFSDNQCDMSARGAWQLESLEFTQVYHYKPGKADWLANGLPIEGRHPGHMSAICRDVMYLPAT